MQIKETNEDPKLRSLTRPIDQTAETREAEPLLPVARPRPTEERREFRERIPGERRKGERRKKDEKVLLDTRNGRERRTAVRRDDDRKSETEAADGGPTPRGIDVEC